MIAKPMTVATAPYRCTRRLFEEKVLQIALPLIGPLLAFLVMVLIQ
jgi:hypothetical protein